MGGVPPLALPLTTTTPSSVYPNLLFPFFSHICALFCAILHFLARIKYATLFFSSDSALFGKNTWGGVPPSLTEEQNEAIPGNLRSITRPFKPSCLRRRSRLSPRCLLRRDADIALTCAWLWDGCGSI